MKKEKQNVPIDFQVPSVTIGRIHIIQKSIKHAFYVFSFVLFAWKWMLKYAFIRSNALQL